MIVVDRQLVDVASAASLAGLGVGITALGVLHALPTGLSPLRNAVSQYGITRYRLGYRVQTLGYAVAGVAAGIALAAIGGVPGAVVALCVVFACARAAISWFPMDTPGGDRTATGRRHGLLAVVAFVAITVAALRLDRASGSLLGSSTATASTVLGALMLVSLLGMAASRRTSGVGFGAIERAFYVLMTAWLVLVPVQALIRG